MGPARTLQLPDQPMDCCFHPTEPVVAVGIINGRLQTWSCSAATPSKRICLQAHSESCRAVHFMPQGSLLLSASANKSILAVDAATGKASARREAAHASGINRLLPVSDDTFATGDDDGLLKLWDTRQPDAIAALQAHTDFVADLALHQQEHCLLSVSGAGTLSVVDLRTRKIRAQSEEDADDELLSVAVVKGGRKVVAGAQSGVLNLFSWGHFQDCSDRFPGHLASVDALAEFDADTLLTGSSDGVIRIVSILPNRMLGVVGEHDAYPVERLSLSHDRRQLVSASHDNTLKLWDLGFLLDAEDDEEEAAEAEEATEAVGGKQQLGASQQEQSSLNEDSSNSEHEREPKASSSRRRRKRELQQESQQAKKSRKASANSNFFRDLL